MCSRHPDFHLWVKRLSIAQSHKSVFYWHVSGNSNATYLDPNSRSTPKRAPTPTPTPGPPPLTQSTTSLTTGSPNPFTEDNPFSNPGIEPGSPALQADSLPTEPSGKPRQSITWSCWFHHEHLSRLFPLLPMSIATNRAHQPLTRNCTPHLSGLCLFYPQSLVQRPIGRGESGWVTTFGMLGRGKKQKTGLKSGGSWGTPMMGPGSGCRVGGHQVPTEVTW